MKKLIITSLLGIMPSLAQNSAPEFEVIDHRPTITFDDWYEHILSHEGGLSNDTDDIDLGEYANHTNKGVTESTYKYLVEEATEAGFNEMAEHRKIAKHFWDKSTKSNNPKIRAFLAEEFWAGGYGALRKYKDKPYEKFGVIKKNRYIALSKKKPKYKRGWAKRNNEFSKLLNGYRDE